MCLRHKPRKGRTHPLNISIQISCISVLAALGLLTACEISAPETHDLFWKRVMFENLELGRTYETLTIFAQVWDADGIEDLDRLFVINDQEQIFWRLSSDDWVIDQSGSGAPWIGSTALAMPEDKSLPGGIYRVIVQDISGKTTEIRFQITENDGPRMTQLAEEINATFQGDELAVIGPFAKYELWAYLSTGSRVFAAPFVDRINVRSLLPNSTPHQELLLYIFASPPDDQTAYLSGPYLWGLH